MKVLVKSRDGRARPVDFARMPTPEEKARAAASLPVAPPKNPDRDPNAATIARLHVVKTRTERQIQALDSMARYGVKPPDVWLDPGKTDADYRKTLMATVQTLRKLQGLPTGSEPGKPGKPSYDPAIASAGVLTHEENARRAAARASGGRKAAESKRLMSDVRLAPLIFKDRFEPPVPQGLQDAVANSPVGRLIDPERARQADRREAARNRDPSRRAAEAAPKPLVADDFNGLRFTMQAFQKGNDEGTVVQGRGGEAIALKVAMDEVAAKTGRRDFPYTASRSSVESRPIHEEATTHVQRSRNSMVGRFIEAQRSNDPLGAQNVAKLGVMGLASEKALHSVGAAADLVDSGTVGSALAQATRADGGALTPGERSALMSDLGRRALATVASAGGLLGVGAEAAPATELGHLLMNAGFQADAGLAGTKAASILLDPYRIASERKEASDELLGGIATSVVPTALLKVARLVPERSVRGAAEAVLRLLRGSRSPAEAVARATERWKLNPRESAALVEAVGKAERTPSGPAMRPGVHLLEDAPGLFLPDGEHLVRNAVDAERLQNLRLEFGTDAGRSRFIDERMGSRTKGVSVTLPELEISDAEHKALKKRLMQLKASNDGARSSVSESEIRDLETRLARAKVVYTPQLVDHNGVPSRKGKPGPVKLHTLEEATLPQSGSGKKWNANRILVESDPTAAAGVSAGDPSLRPYAKLDKSAPDVQRIVSQAATTPVDGKLWWEGQDIVSARKRMASWLKGQIRANRRFEVPCLGENVQARFSDKTIEKLKILNADGIRITPNIPDLLKNAHLVHNSAPRDLAKTGMDAASWVVARLRTSEGDFDVFMLIRRMHNGDFVYDQAHQHAVKAWSSGSSVPFGPQ